MNYLGSTIYHHCLKIDIDPNALDVQWEELFVDFHAGGAGDGGGEDAEVESLDHPSVAEVFDVLLKQGRAHVTRSTTKQLMAAGM